MNALNPPLKRHMYIGILLGIWGFLFAFFARPFEHGYMDLEVWIYVSVGFSLLASLSYIVVGFVQQLISQRISHWNVFLEIGVYILFYFLYTLVSYLYYISPFVNGIYHFSEFFVKIILNIILISSPILFFTRRYTLRLIPEAEAEEQITIKGENQLDILIIKPSELICISNAQNYVEIIYLDGQEVKSKLMRSSLKKMQTDLPFLIQVHRSHLINPVHFRSWKDATTISLSKIELPVSKKYKHQLPSS